MIEARKAGSARQRARAARAAVLESQRVKERRIEDAYTAAFEALQAVQAAELGVQAAEMQLASSVAALRDERESQPAIAAALELPAKDIQRLLRAAEARKPAAAGTPSAG